LDDVSIFTEYIGRQIRALKDPTKMLIMQNTLQKAMFECHMSLAAETGNPTVIDITGDKHESAHKKQQQGQHVPKVKPGKSKCLPKPHSVDTATSSHKMKASDVGKPETQTVCDELHVPLQHDKEKVSQKNGANTMSSKKKKSKTPAPSQSTPMRTRSRKTKTMVQQPCVAHDLTPENSDQNMNNDSDI
jgi:hypothetical protein